jgi:hypothetical protein
VAGSWRRSRGRRSPLPASRGKWGRGRPSIKARRVRSGRCGLVSASMRMSSNRPTEASVGPMFAQDNQRARFVSFGALRAHLREENPCDGRACGHGGQSQDKEYARHGRCQRAPSDGGETIRLRWIKVMRRSAACYFFDRRRCQQFADCRNAVSPSFKRCGKGVILDDRWNDMPMGDGWLCGPRLLPAPALCVTRRGPRAAAPVPAAHHRWPSAAGGCRRGCWAPNRVQAAAMPGGRRHDTLQHRRYKSGSAWLAVS